VLSPCLCKNNNGIVKAYLRVPLDVKGLRLGPQPSPALVGQPSLGRVTLSTPLDALQHGWYLYQLTVSQLSRDNALMTSAMSGNEALTADFT